VRATEVDKVEIYKSFRPGDIVSAEIVRSHLPSIGGSSANAFLPQISLGDARSYFLSTAKNELGVIYAKSVANVTVTLLACVRSLILWSQMIPISWNQMQCPKTKTKEFRKVAKVV
jgi:exosome complex component CSL4